MRLELSWFTSLPHARLARLALVAACLWALPAQTAAQADEGTGIEGDLYIDTARGTPPALEPPPELSVTVRNKVTRALKKFTSKKEQARASQVETVLEAGRGAVPLLVEHAETTSEEKQAEVAHCLTVLADGRDRFEIEDWLESEHVALRRAGATLAGRIATERLVRGLPRLLEDEDAAVRFETALSLAATGQDDGVDVLVERFDESTAARIVEAAAGLAGTGSHSRLRKHLIVDEEAAKRDPHAAALPRRAAVAMLEGIGDRAAISALSKVLDDPHSLVQLDAIDALRKLLEDAEPFNATSIFAQIKEVERLKGLAGG